MVYSGREVREAMATSCNIIVEDSTHRVQLYRSCYGYPKRILPDLADALVAAFARP